MLPNIWIFDTYTVLMYIGIALALVVYFLYGRKINMNKGYMYSILILACIAISIGILSASLFQILFNFLKHDGESLSGMTFFGGLFGGALSFLLIYFLYYKKKYPNESFIENVLIIAPACITIAHSVGRVGCFTAGCCYGIETESKLGVMFPGMTVKVLPTQLFEACFLFVLFVVLFLLAMKLKFKYTMCIYTFSYGIWRFIIEFYRGDDRGAFFIGLSPSQWFSILAVAISFVLFVYLFKTKNMNKIKSEDVGEDI